MALTRYEFEVLAYLEREGKRHYPIRQISDNLCISGTSVMKCIMWCEHGRRTSKLAADGH